MSNKQKKIKDVNARRRRMHERGRIPWSYLLPVIIIIIIVAGLVYVNSKESTSVVTNGSLSQGSYNFPFSCLPQEQLFLHIHPWLRVIINGQNVTIPAAIGIKSPTFQNGIAVSGTCFEPSHTHDSSGIIHIESPTNTTYTLGDFFQIWSATYVYAIINGTKEPIAFNATDILGFKADSAHKVVLLVDGQQTYAYGSLVLNTLDYCNASNSASPSSPCHATAQGNPASDSEAYPFGTEHTIVIEYETFS